MSQRNQNIKLRLGQKDDARKIFNLHRRAIHEIASNDYSPEIINAWGRKFSLEELDRKQEKFEAYLKEGNIVVIAEINEVLAGFGEVMPLRNELVAAYVNPDFKRQRVGTAILKNLELRAKAKGLKYLQLSSSITAVPFYKKNGFKAEKQGTHTLSTGVKMACVMMNKKIA
jgi:putative acetyltransferase